MTLERKHTKAATKERTQKLKRRVEGRQTSTPLQADTTKITENLKSVARNEIREAEAGLRINNTSSLLPTHSSRAASITTIRIRIRTSTRTVIRTNGCHIR